MKRKVLSRYASKCKGYEKCPKCNNKKEYIFASIYCFVAILIISFIDTTSQLLFLEQPLFVAPVGASAIMIFGLPESNYAQPRNVIGGHFFSALCGITAFMLFGENVIFASAVGVGLSMAFMAFTNTIHPPGGATALLCVIGGDAITSLGYSFAFVPCLTNGVLLVTCGIFLNNLSSCKQYPKYW